MGTATCPACAAEYVAKVTTCADCGVALAGDAAFGPDDDVVAYDLADWVPLLRAELSTALGAQGVGHQWEGTELVVPEASADLVEHLVDELDHPDALEVDDDADDDGGAEVLSTLYVASDLLVGDPHRAAAAAELQAAAAAAVDMPAPYGLDGATWEEVRRRATALAGLLGDTVLPGGDVDEDAVVAAARSLREAVHHLV
jgi:hypothetical protein